MQRIVECVPNISAGRDKAIFEAVAEAIREAETKSGGAVRLLDVDPGADTNRTVLTFAGDPEAVLDAAWCVYQTAAALIDMRGHHGAHPRHGAIDVCPFVPVRGVGMEECAELARRLAARVGAPVGEGGLGIPVYLYEAAASMPARRNLAQIRAGEYEALPGKLGTPEWNPDSGPNAWTDAVARTGVTAIGARNFLVAYNINFNTRDSRLVNEIALDVREKGRIARGPDGKFMRDERGDFVYAGGAFQHTKAMGWYIEEFHCAQLTMNLTDATVTPPHIVFDHVCDLAATRGLRVTGSELVGMLPLACLTEAGRYFLDKQRKVCTGVSERELVRLAVQTMGLSEVKPFDAQRSVIEYALDTQPRPLASMALRDFADELASVSPAPGGGSVAALAGALGAGLAAMVPQLTVGKRGYVKVRSLMNDTAIEAQALKDGLLRAIDDDTAAFNRLMDSFRLPKATPEQEAERTAAIGAATRACIAVPLAVLSSCARIVELCLVCAREGNQNALSDAGTGGSMAQACAEGAYYNVRINLKSLPAPPSGREAEQEEYRALTAAEADGLLARVRDLADELRAVMAAGLAV
jgi:glutamate formiminotransferase/formiminotetrahydrofolate cyclodeaminase